MKSAHDRAVELFWRMGGMMMSLKDYRASLNLDIFKPTRELITVAERVIESDRRELLAWDAEQDKVKP